MRRRRREQTPDARPPAELSDAELDSVIEQAIHETSQSGDAGWKALRDWTEAQQEKDRRRLGRGSGPILVRKEE